MQYHLNGYRSGDPRVAPVSQSEVPDIYDVTIVGTGPAGLTLAAYMAQFPEVSTLVLEAKPGPIERGQADGVSCRSMEMFQAFGFAGRVMDEAYYVNETVFWRPDRRDTRKIARSGRIQDVEDGLSEMPHVILNQARVHAMYLDVMRNSPSRLVPRYDAAVQSLTVGELNQLRLKSGETIQSRYVIGCDGARSLVRQSIGRNLSGEAANKAWGVMDILAVTDFPDIRFKSLIQSKSEGTIIVIPREGGYLVRLYIELDQLKADERVKDRDIGLEDLIAAAQRILHPYSLDVKEVPWWSVYEIGQRLTDSFQDDSGTVFIAGDACHTHSPKAGQGMNVGMGDSFNLAWKLAAVLRGQADPKLLRTYSDERQAVAQDLIDFDREWSRIIAQREAGDETPQFQRYFIEHGRYTAGVAVKYAPSIITGTNEHQALAKGFQIGMRFHSAPVIRLADGKRIELGHTILADGRWRVFLFGSLPRIRRFCEHWEQVLASARNQITHSSEALDAVLDLRAILPVSHRDIDISDVPNVLRPAKGRYGLTDYEKVFCPDLKSGPNIFDIRGVDGNLGAVVVVRPDQYVAHVLPLNPVDELVKFLDLSMRPLKT